jgi:S1-C subfamily serine protease
VVKVFATQQQVDFAEPWKPGTPETDEGCGAILSGGRVLTNARFVDQSNFIEVQKYGETRRFVAKVSHISNDLDLAILTIEDKDFVSGTEPVELGDMPAPGDKVVLQGGDVLSHKEDTLSGLDMVWSITGATGVPALETQGDIDKTLYGCPAFKDGKFIGMPFLSYHKDDKIGTLTPVNVVRRYLDSVNAGKDYPGMPDPGVYVQLLKSADLRDYYKLPPDKSGVVVTRIFHGGAAEGFLKEGDVLSEAAGHAIDNEGYTQVEKLGRVSVDYPLSLLLPGEVLKLKIYRDGKPMEIEFPMKNEVRLLAWQPDNPKPTYFMKAGFVFVPLTYNYLLADWNHMKPELKVYFNHGLPTADRKEIVVLSHVLQADINAGYQYFNNVIVQKVNGRAIGSMRDLVDAFDHPQGKHHVIEFDDHSWSGSMIVFDAKKAEKATKALMKEQGIVDDRSDDLKGTSEEKDESKPTRKLPASSMVDNPVKAEPSPVQKSATKTSEIEIKL